MMHRGRGGPPKHQDMSLPSCAPGTSHNPPLFIPAYRDVPPGIHRAHLFQSNGRIQQFMQDKCRSTDIPVPPFNWQVSPSNQDLMDCHIRAMFGQHVDVEDAPSGHDYFEQVSPMSTGAACTVQRSNLMDVLKVAQKFNLHVIHDGLADAGESQLHTSNDAIPADVPAILVLVDCTDMGIAEGQRILQAVTEGDQQLPVLALLLEAPGPAVQDCDFSIEGLALSLSKKVAALEKATLALFLSGANDVVKQPVAREDLITSLAVGVAKAQAQIKEVLAYEAELNKCAALGGTNNMFWECAHMVFKGFPVMDPKLEETQEKIGNRQLEGFLGQGSFGKVFRAQDTVTGEQVAVKVLHKSVFRSPQQVVNIFNECRALKLLKHENIARFHELIHGRQRLYICMDFAGSQHLGKIVEQRGGKLSLSDARGFVQQIVSAVAYCHDNDLAHRDLKAANVVVADGGHAKLVDFGMAVKLGRPRTDCCGSLPTVAPEVLVEKSYNPGPADVWSIGIILFEIVCGMSKVFELLGWKLKAPPPLRAAVSEKLAGIFRCRTTIDRELKASCMQAPEALLALLHGMTEVLPQKRWSATQAMQHTWLVESQKGE